MTRKPIGVTSPYRKIGCVQHDCERCQRGWVGLTDEEVNKMWDFYKPAAFDFYVAIEAKLKEKNR